VPSGIAVVALAFSPIPSLAILILIRELAKKTQEKQRFQRASPPPQEFLKNFSTRLNKV
jgi:hypothetical protein